MIFQIYSYALNITWKKQCLANFWPPTAPGPRTLHTLHTLLLRHWKGKVEGGEKLGRERDREENGLDPWRWGHCTPHTLLGFAAHGRVGSRSTKCVWQLCALRSIHARQLISAACHVTHLWPITWEHRSSCWDDKWKENKNADAFAIPVCTVTRHICWAPQ